MNKKIIAVVTGTRAEYGLLKPVIQRISQSDKLSLKLLVTGAHLRKEYGRTITEIEKDNIKVTQKFDILCFGEGDLAVAKSTSLAIDMFATWFSQNQVDALLVLGDRYEIFAAAVAAALMNVQVFHISGGDVTMGAKDEWFRHSISKMASLHFPSCAPYAQRLINMGEEPQRIFTVGGLGDENIRFLKLHDIKVLSRLLKFDFEKSFSLVTYHPQTLGGTSPRAEMQSLLNAMEKYPRENFVITKSNADAGGSEINNMIDDFVATHENAVCFASMGVVNYLSAMKFAHAVIGNSSSGVVETPSFAVPCVNIGDRQKGRIISDNVICCSTDEDEIFRALKLAFSKEFAMFARKTVSPYDGGRTSEKIVDNIVKYFESDLSKKNKTFHDLKGVVLDTN